MDMDVLSFCGCYMLGRSLCDGPIPRSEESHRLWHVMFVM